MSFSSSIPSSPLTSSGISSSTFPSPSDTTPPPTSPSPPPTQPPSSQPSSQPPSSSSNPPSSSLSSSSPPPNESSSAPPSSSSSAPSSSSQPSSSSTSVLTKPTTSSTISTSVGTSNGQVFTTVVGSTITLQPGTAVTTTPHPSNRSSTTNTGAIVGGVVGGVGGALLVAILLIFLYRRHKKNRERAMFDGNFDPAHVVQPTAPRISLTGDDQPDQADDGMGGRLGTGIGGVISPFAYVPHNEMDASSTNHSFSNPEMRQYPHDPLYQQQQLPNPHSPSHSEAYSYGTRSPPPPSASDSGTTSSGYYQQSYYGMQPQNPHQLHQLYGTGSGGAAGGEYSGVSRAESSSGHGHDHGPRSVTTTTTNRSAKELEAFPGHRAPHGSGMALGLTNPDPSSASDSRGVLEDDEQTAGPVGTGMNEARRQAYLQHGPIVHQDAGRFRDEQDKEDEEGEQPAEIPPTYDSLPINERRR